MKTLTAAVLIGLASMMPAADAAGPTTVTGELALKLTITIVSSIATSTSIQCGLNATVSGSSPAGQHDSINETDTVNATRSGKTAVCQLAIPYQWILYGAGDTVGLSYSISAQNGPSSGRYSSVSFETIAAPKNGATTSYALKARI